MKPVTKTYTGWVEATVSNKAVISFDQDKNGDKSVVACATTKAVARRDSYNGKARKVRVTITVEDVI